MSQRNCQFGFICLLLSALVNAQAETFIYQETDGTRWITNRTLDPERFIFIDKYGRPSATRSCRGVTPVILAQRAERHMPSIVRYAAQHQVEIELVKAVITVESCFDASAISRAGAQGLMQLMPETARQYGILDSFNPEQNLSAGTAHLKDLLLHFKQNLELSLAAYNAGLHNVKKYKGIPPFQETRNYVPKVLKYYRQYRQEAGLSVADIP